MDMMFLFLLTVKIYFILCDTSQLSIGQYEPDTRMIGGTNAIDEQFPYQASLIDAIQEYHFCGGAIISRLHVVTAAHCICESRKRQPKEVKVLVGLIRRQQIGQKLKVSKVFCHPNYEEVTGYHDIALIKTSKEIIFNSHVQQIQVLSIRKQKRSLPIIGGLNVVISGWGSDSIKGNISKSLQYITTTTINLTSCRNMLGKLGKNVQVWNVCTYDPHQKRTCLGDSGGPIVLENALLALISWSIKCDKYIPGVHTSLLHHVDWLHKVLIL